MSDFTGTATHREHARRLVESAGQQVKEVVAVDHDSILFVTPEGHARTAWLRHYKLANETAVSMAKANGSFRPADPCNPYVQVAVIVEDGFTI